MLFAISLLAAFAYALQGTLMASCYREMEQLSAVAYRGLSLIVSMSPILLLAPAEAYSAIPQFIPSILAASLLAALANLAAAHAYCHLPVGIASSLTMSFATLTTAVLGFFFLNDPVTGEQLLLIGLMLLAIGCLGRSNSTGPLPLKHDPLRGVGYSALFGVLIGSSYGFLTDASQGTHPFIAGFLWETVIGCIAVLLAFGRRRLGGLGLAPVSPEKFRRILYYSAPTAVGTGCFAYASAGGSIVIASALLSTIMVFSTLLAMVIYREKLSTVQWSLVLIVCALVAGLHLA